MQIFGKRTYANAFCVQVPTGSPNTNAGPFAKCASTLCVQSPIDSRLATIRNEQPLRARAQLTHLFKLSHLEVDPLADFCKRKHANTFCVQIPIDSQLPTVRNDNRILPLSRPVSTQKK